VTVRIAQTHYGRVLIPDTEVEYHNVQGSGVYVEHVYIEKVLAILKDRPRGVVVDAGANYGFWSLALAPLADQVIAIEPQRGIHQMLCGTVVLNDLTFVVFPHQVALGEQSGQIEIALVDYNQPGMFGGLSVGCRSYPPEQDKCPPFKVIGWEPVRVVALDDCLDVAQPVSFIKMDIEGSEERALRGAVKTIARWRPPMFVECEHFLTDSESLRSFFKERDYRVLDLKRNFLCMPS
jgi:FkbM family methyltransferase